MDEDRMLTIQARQKRLDQSRKPSAPRRYATMNVCESTTTGVLLKLLGEVEQNQEMAQ